MKIRIALAVAALFSTGIVLDAEADHDIDPCQELYWQASEAMYKLTEAIEKRQTFENAAIKHGLPVLGASDKWVEFNYDTFMAKLSEYEECKQ